MSKRTSRLTRPLHPMPYFVRKALTEHGLMDAYRERPPYQKNDYLGWILRAKLEQTRKKRLSQMLDELARGDRYMKMACHRATGEKIKNIEQGL
jgi:Bacteriocin-protection, YdeI or OmpD-Associated